MHGVAFLQDLAVVMIFAGLVSRSRVRAINSRSQPPSGFGPVPSLLVALPILPVRKDLRRFHFLAHDLAFARPIFTPHASVFFASSASDTVLFTSFPSLSSVASGLNFEV